MSEAQISLFKIVSNPREFKSLSVMETFLVKRSKSCSDSYRECYFLFDYVESSISRQTIENGSLISLENINDEAKRKDRKIVLYWQWFRLRSITMIETDFGAICVNKKDVNLTQISTDQYCKTIPALNSTLELFALRKIEISSPPNSSTSNT